MTQTKHATPDLKPDPNVASPESLFLPAGNTMDQMMTLVSFAAAFAGLIAGYFVGYRSGTVAGELAALKSMQHRHDRDSSTHRQRRSSSENRQEGAS